MTTTLEHPIRTSARSESDAASLEAVSGIFDLQEQHGFLRVAGYRPSAEDLYVPNQLIRAHGLRAGDLIDGLAAPRAAGSPASGRSGRGGQTKANPLVRIALINGRAPGQAERRPRFAELTPVHPSERLRLEIGPETPSTRIMDLLTPIGKGQRGLIVAQPKTGKTMILQALAKAVSRNHPECHLMVVLLDERPEEVTDMRRSVSGEVIASTFDRPAHEHVALAELAVERAKRLAEQGTDVVILLDSLTRLCRAHNNNAKPGGRTLTGGVDAAAVAGPKKLFGAARNLEGAGSITILATALIDTGSRADDYYFEELKSTGNMELRLDRTLAGKRVYPAIELTGSSTRRDELLVPADELDAVRRLRRVLVAQSGEQAIELLLERMRHTATNAEFLHQIRQTTPSAEA
ncbi:MAG TPA: transcription termination factor Rho [Actinospica sp.]|nr:transcription termination factor Rho [Actinospica sp.]